MKESCRDEFHTEQGVRKTFEWLICWETSKYWCYNMYIPFVKIQKYSSRESCKKKLVSTTWPHWSNMTVYCSGEVNRGAIKNSFSKKTLDTGFADVFWTVSNCKRQSRMVPFSFNNYWITITTVIRSIETDLNGEHTIFFGEFFFYG